LYLLLKIGKKKMGKKHQNSSKHLTFAVAKTYFIPMIESKTEKLIGSEKFFSSLLFSSLLFSSLLKR